MKVRRNTKLTTRPARFYLLPKIHKPGNPGRPIVASCEAPTEKISELLDHNIRPLLQLSTWETQRPPTTDLAELISEILKKNKFVIGDQHYLQVHGTAMGTQMAPSYANLLMAPLEKQLLVNTSTKTLIWWQYIDDIFTIWSHGEAALKRFLEYLNHAHPTIKFTAEWSHESVSLLDTRVPLVPHSSGKRTL